MKDLVVDLAIIWSSWDNSQVEVLMLTLYWRVFYGIIDGISVSGTPSLVDRSKENLTEGSQARARDRDQPCDAW